MTFSLKSKHLNIYLMEAFKKHCTCKLHAVTLHHTHVEKVTAQFPPQVYEKKHKFNLGIFD